MRNRLDTHTAPHGHGGNVVPEGGPIRPSHYGEDNNEFIPKDHTDLDYATEEHVDPTAVGFPPAPQATPVYLTETPPVSRLIKPVQIETLTVDNTVANTSASRTQIAANSPNRTRLIIRNLDAANSVFITQDAMNLNQAFAYELPFGQREEFLHNRALWVFCAATKTAKISVFREFETDDLG